jgi:hypothetical protein
MVEMVTVSKITNKSGRPASLVGKNNGVPTGWACYVVPAASSSGTTAQTFPGDLGSLITPAIDTVDWTIGSGPYDWGIITEAGLFWIYDRDWKIWIEPVDGRLKELTSVKNTGSINLIIDERGGISV